MIKNESANKHIPIFVRLNLLKVIFLLKVNFEFIFINKRLNYEKKAILNYHKGKKRECKQSLDTANRELQKVIIDDDKLVQVMSMGFTNTEARLALRSSFNNVDAAIEQIFKVFHIILSNF
jgi:hypothetical protein